MRRQAQTKRVPAEVVSQTVIATIVEAKRHLAERSEEIIDATLGAGSKARSR
ncbi:hypothetical protein [Glycomyces buryatensis]|uniref:hypothetical protein n=1 Tax=Glycomyces buryatensis TaxID=2570927 RepID=UPI0014562A6F|nr:hypothetical protein [Glycomyces buryatensis]